MRINKFLTLCGLGSRRKVEELITAGRICRNGTPLKKLGTVIDPENDTITFDGRIIKMSEDSCYLILNKPRGYVTTFSDEKGRPTVMELIPEKYRRIGVFPVGRLDMDTEGLLLLTNDGELAQRLNHPRFKVSKRYLVELDKPLQEEDKKKIQKGIFVHQIGIKTRPVRINPSGMSKKFFTITLKEGKKRQIRYTFKNFGYRVVKLRRVAYGPLTLENVNKGEIRPLKAKEVRLLEKFVSGESE